jgi:hypothetical protein
MTMNIGSNGARFASLFLICSIKKEQKYDSKMRQWNNLPL